MYIFSCLVGCHTHTSPSLFDPAEMSPSHSHRKERDDRFSTTVPETESSPYKHTETKIYPSCKRKRRPDADDLSIFVAAKYSTCHCFGCRRTVETPVLEYHTGTVVGCTLKGFGSCNRDLPVYGIRFTERTSTRYVPTKQPSIRSSVFRLAFVVV